jgi:hypothetical protein
MEKDPNWADAKGIGDVNSNEKGSGARFNNGKPAMELLPLREVATLLMEPYVKAEIIPAEIAAISHLAAFQEGADNAVFAAMKVLGDPQETLVECAQVFDYGKRKYAEWNWAKGMNWSIPLACAVRHLMAMLRGEWIDPIEEKGSGLPHRGHVMCNLMMLATYLRTFREGDDRPIKWLASPKNSEKPVSETKNTPGTYPDPYIGPKC